MTRSVSRRDVLVSAGSLGGVGLAGCIDSSEHGRQTEPSDLEYSLFSFQMEGSSIGEEFRWEATNAREFPASFQRDAIDELLVSGSATTEEYALVTVEQRPNGTFVEPRFVEHDGTYYRITVADEREITRERWVFWLDHVDEPPTDATVVTGVPDDLSEHDRRRCTVALQRVTRSRRPPREVADDPLADRGYVYLEPDDPEASDLVPEPPFTHVESEDGSYFEAKSTNGEVTLKQWTYELEPVGSTSAEYEQYLGEEVLAATFEEDALSGDAQSIVEQLARQEPYQEFTPISGEFETILQRLGLDALEPPEDGEDRRSTTQTVYFEFDDERYKSWLSIYYRNRPAATEKS